MRRALLFLAGFGALASALALLPLPRGAAQEGGGDGEAVEAARLFRSRCASCHVIPDPQRATDQAWIGQIAVTAWSGTAPRARAALQRHLSSAGLVRPRPIETSGQAKDWPQARVATSIAEGEIFLRDASGAEIRLAWKAGETGARERLLAPDRYRLVGYRIVSGDWFLSSTSPGRPLDLTADAPRRLEMDGVLHVRLRAQRGMLSAMLSDAGHRGVSLYHKGKRIPLLYVVERSGVQVAEGQLSYGWGGGANAPLGHDASGAVARLVLPAGVPFKIQGSLSIPLR